MNLVNSHILEVLSLNHIQFLKEKIIVLQKLHSLIHRLGDRCCLQILTFIGNGSVRQYNSRKIHIYYIFQPVCVTTVIIITFHGSKISSDYDASLCINFYIQHHSHCRGKGYTIFFFGLFMMEL